MKKYLIVILFFLTYLCGGEISISISEDLVNEYLTIVGNHEILAGKKENQATWTIKNPRAKFEDGEALFMATTIYNKGKTNIKKDIKKNIDVKYDSNKNMVKLIIIDPIVKMERKGELLGKIDLSTIYQTGLIFPGPRPNFNSFKLKTKNGKIKVNINTSETYVYFEKDIIRLALELNYK